MKSAFSSHLDAQRAGVGERIRAVLADLPKQEARVGGAVPKGAKQRDCMITIDVVPYAHEAPVLAQISRDAGREVVVISDEFCHWAQDFTELVFHAPSRNGLLLESTGALVSLASILVHGVAELDEVKTDRRLRRWRSMTRKLNVF